MIMKMLTDICIFIMSDFEDEEVTPICMYISFQNFSLVYKVLTKLSSAVYIHIHVYENIYKMSCNLCFLLTVS
jgi:hypothetical protein